MPDLTIHVSEDRALTGEGLLDALSSQFQEYDVYHRWRSGGQDPNTIIIRKSTSRGVMVKLRPVNQSDEPSWWTAGGQVIELHGVIPLGNMADLTGALLVLAAPIATRVDRAAWQEMGEEVTNFLQQKYDP
jgi:hypothetical protein